MLRERAKELDQIRQALRSTAEQVDRTGEHRGQRAEEVDRDQGRWRRSWTCLWPSRCSPHPCAAPAGTRHARQQLPQIASGSGKTRLAASSSRWRMRSSGAGARPRWRRISRRERSTLSSLGAGPEVVRRCEVAESTEHVRDAAERRLAEKLGACGWLLV